jgi:hypothetical protein
MPQAGPNPQSQQVKVEDRILKPRGHWDRQLTRIFTSIARKFK